MIAIEIDALHVILNAILFKLARFFRFFFFLNLVLNHYLPALIFFVIHGTKDETRE